MQKIIKFASVLLLSFCAASVVNAATMAVTDVKASHHFASQVSVVNQSAYSYTVTATYMSQAGVSRKYVMALNAYPYAGSTIQFPITLPEYAVYLQIVRNIDGYPTYSGYVSSDDVYIYAGLNSAKPTVDVKHH